MYTCQWEYHCSEKFDEFLNENGMIQQLLVSYNPAPKGLIEKMNRTQQLSLFDQCYSNTLSIFWAQAVNTIPYPWNRSLKTALDAVTWLHMNYCLVKSQMLHISKCWVFSIQCMFVITREQSLINAKSKKVIFVGYPENTKGYKLYNLSIVMMLCTLNKCSLTLFVSKPPQNFLTIH